MLHMQTRYDTKINSCRRSPHIQLDFDHLKIQMKTTVLCFKSVCHLMVNDMITFYRIIDSLEKN